MASSHVGTPHSRTGRVPVDLEGRRHRHRATRKYRCAPLADADSARSRPRARQAGAWPICWISSYTPTLRSLVLHSTTMLLVPFVLATPSPSAVASEASVDAPHKTGVGGEPNEQIQVAYSS